MDKATMWALAFLSAFCLVGGVVMWLLGGLVVPAGPAFVAIGIVIVVVETVTLTAARDNAEKELA